MASVQDLSSKYGSQLRQLKAIFPTWDEGDLAFTLQDVKGSVEDAALAITEGRASQFTEAPSKKKATKPTAKESTGRGHSNRNADSGGWENAGANGDRGDRAARGGRGGARGGRGGGRGGEPFRGGGRGGRGGARGGRGGYSNTNGAAQTAANGEASTTDTTTDGWAAQVEQASGADNGGWGAAEGDAAESSTQAAAAASGKGDDFAAAGGWGDAPSAKEVSKAAKSGGQGWAGKGKQAVSAVNTAAPAPAVPAKKTWAQIAKPVEKPKPVPAPAPAKEEPKPAAVEETPAPAEEEPQATEEQVEAFGDAPAPQEIEEQAAAIPETQAEVEPAVTQPDVPLEPETQQEEAEFVDPAIAGSGGTGSQPSWAQTLSQGKTEAPEPVTTYTGPPGFDSTQTTKGPVAQAQAQQPRSNSRAAQRFKNAEGQGVVLPGSVSSGLNNMDMQFGSLSFGALNPDGSDVPVPEQATPAKSAAQLSPVTSPRGLQQPSAPAAPLPQVAQQQQQPAASSYPYMSQQTQPGFPQSQPTQHQQQPQAQQQLPHSVQLQQQASAYQHLHQQQQHQHQQSQEQQSVAQQQPQQQPQQHQYYRPNDFYGAQSHDLGSSHNQTPSQQQQPVQPPSSASPYDSAFGAFGQQQSHQQLYGQAQQHQQHSTPSQNDAFSAGRQAYDSYGAAGYGRPSEEPKPPISAPPPSHTPTAPAQQQQQQPQGLQQQQHQQYQGYPQMGNMGYYQNAAYNPYYQYGQAPQPGFQQYYPLAGRNLYGQPTPPAPPAPIPQSKPAHASPYGAHGQPYPSSTYDDQSSYNGGGGRFGGSDIKAPSAQSTGAYSNPSLHGFLGQSTNSSSRQQASTPDEGFKSSTPQSSVGGASQQAGAQAQQQPNQRAGGPQGFGAGAGAGYPYSGGYQAQAQDWSQYGQYGGGRNGGYGSWGQQ